jgi:preprotein translocase subunit SecF
MKKIIRFSRIFLPATIFSLIVIVFGLVGYVKNDGFNLGVDFKAGSIQEVQFAPSAFTLTYGGEGNASVSFSRAGMDVVLSGSNVDGHTYSFSYADYPTLQSLTMALNAALDGLSAEMTASGSVGTEWFVQNALGDPHLNNQSYVVHYLEPDSAPIDLAKVRESLSSLGSASVQVLGAPSDRHFMIRMDEGEDVETASTDEILHALETGFGQGEVVITRSDFVGSRFSRQLTEQAGLLLFLTLLLILIYVSIRFKPQFAVGGVLAVMHDALVMIAFIAWTRMEFNTTTIAALLTILGYSINDTIVIFDRIRETKRVFPDDSFVGVIDRSITETLSRTIITTLTTMLAVVSLYIFTTGSMKDFALALLVGMCSGVYSTIFIACGFANFWEDHIKKRGKRAKKAPLSAAARA